MPYVTHSPVKVCKDLILLLPRTPTPATPKSHSIPREGGGAFAKDILHPGRYIAHSSARGLVVSAADFYYRGQHAFYDIFNIQILRSQHGKFTPTVDCCHIYYLNALIYMERFTGLS